MISILKYTRPNEIKLYLVVVPVPVGGVSTGAAAAGAAATHPSEYPGFSMHEILDAVGNAKYKMLKALGYYDTPIQSREDPRYLQIMLEAALAAALQSMAVDTRRGYTPVSLNISAIPNYANLIGQYGNALQLDLMGQRVALQIQEREALALRQLAALEELHRRLAELGPTTIATSATVSLPDYLYGDGVMLSKKKKKKKSNPTNTPTETPSEVPTEDGAIPTASTETSTEGEAVSAETPAVAGGATPPPQGDPEDPKKKNIIKRILGIEGNMQIKPTIGKIARNTARILGFWAPASTAAATAMFDLGANFVGAALEPSDITHKWIWPATKARFTLERGLLKGVGDMYRADKQNTSSEEEDSTTEEERAKKEEDLW